MLNFEALRQALYLFFFKIVEDDKMNIFPRSGNYKNHYLLVR